MVGGFIPRRAARFGPASSVPQDHRPGSASKKPGTSIQTIRGPGASNNRGCHRMTKVRRLIGFEGSSDSTAMAGSGPVGGPKHLKETYRSVDSSIAEFGVGLPLPLCRSLNGCGQTVRFDHHSPGAGPRRQPFPGSRTSTPPGPPEKVDNRSVTSPPSENCNPAAPCETPPARVDRQRCPGAMIGSASPRVGRHELS